MTAADRAAAVEIVIDMLPDDVFAPRAISREVVTALDAAGWLHDPSYVAELEAVVQRIRAIHFPAPEYDGEAIQFCDSCRVMWPCPTADAVPARPAENEEE